MSAVVEFVSFTLKEGISEQQLIAASDAFETGFLSLQKGYTSRQLIKGKDAWADIALWETMEDALNAVEAVEQSSAAEAYDACIEEGSVQLQHFSIVKSY